MEKVNCFCGDVILHSIRIALLYLSHIQWYLSEQCLHTIIVCTHIIIHIISMVFVYYIIIVIQ